MGLSITDLESTGCGQMGNSDLALRVYVIPDIGMGAGGEFRVVNKSHDNDTTCINRYRVLTILDLFWQILRGIALHTFY